jgi:aspartyl protease family protein
MPSFPPHLLLYLGAALALAIVVNAIARRIPVIGTAFRLGSWAVLLVLLLVAVQQRQRFDPYFATITRLFNLEGERQQVSGNEVRIPLSPDGHFWVRVQAGGVERRMLVDSGATITAISSETAAALGLQPEPALFPVILKTANGSVTARTATVRDLRIGNIVARNLAVVISPAFGDTNVIGMNFLSRLKSWRVEDGTLVLVPHHPQEVGG